MKLVFNLLVIHDIPISISQAIATLEDHLDIRGFDLSVVEPNPMSLQVIRDLAENSGRNFDLVAVDFNLANDEFDGRDMTSSCAASSSSLIWFSTPSIPLAISMVV